MQSVECLVATKNAKKMKSIKSILSVVGADLLADLDEKLQAAKTTTDKEKLEKIKATFIKRKIA